MSVSMDVIVRTMADTARAGALFSALDSIQTQVDVAARPIVVVNGPRADQAVLAALAKRPGILVHRIPEASAGCAMGKGRELVTAPYFGYLDDDDTFIEGALRQPLARISATPTCDVLVTNGLFVPRSGPSTEFTHMEYHVRDPLRGLLRENWLQPGGFIGRTATVEPRLVASDWSNMEWTKLALELCAAHKNIEFMDVPTVRYNDTPGSASKQRRQGEASVQLWQWVAADKRFDSDIRRGARHNRARTLHNMAWQCWLDGERRKAWLYHLASLRSRQLLRYAAFTRKLVFGGKRP